METRGFLWKLLLNWLYSTVGANKNIKFWRKNNFDSRRTYSTQSYLTDWALILTGYKLSLKATTRMYQACLIVNLFVCFQMSSKWMKIEKWFQQTAMGKLSFLHAGFYSHFTLNTEPEKYCQYTERGHTKKRSSRISSRSSTLHRFHRIKRFIGKRFSNRCSFPAVLSFTRWLHQYDFCRKGKGRMSWFHLII